MQIMPIRLKMLQEAYAGLEQTGVSLVACRDGKFYSAGFSDDVGMYLIIPKLAGFLGLSVPQAIDLFYYALIGGSFALAIAGCCFLYRRFSERLVALLGLCIVAGLVLKTGDIYVFGPCLAVAFVPWLILSVRKSKIPVGFVWWALTCSFAVGCFHLMRSHSGTAVLLFSAVLLLFRCEESLKHKGFILLAMLAIWAIPSLFVQKLGKRASDTISAHEALYPPGTYQHPFWHSVYIGLGFVNNPYVSAYKDEVAVEKVRTIDPSVGFLSEEYEAILKREVFKITNGSFWIMNVGAKTGVIALYLLLYTNIGLVLRLRSKTPVDCEWAFVIAAAFSALPGILVVPYRSYLLGLIAFAVLYNIVHVNRHVSLWTQRYGRPDDATGS